ncbi:hypothetical protein [Salinicola sp. RZ23]|uniref:hypothetical protein n=1 Tax=Salinicola sp. RZ23 TaxID=1949087 RepID=UPI0013006268|nr:hypothetical protein [Salinicola sp. RZ23]
MVSEFLKFGYLGLVAMLVYLCYRIIEGSKSGGHSFKETIIILCFFSLVSLIGGGSGYLWAEKELEVAKTKESTASILKQQLLAERESHEKAVEPLQNALDGAAESFNSSVLNSTRQEYIQEINQLNKLIQTREDAFSNRVQALKDVFNQVTDA